VHKDFYYYKSKNDKVHRGMHNLSGLFLKAEGLQEIKGKKMYCFSISFPSKNRVYYCDNETDYNNWVEVLKKATGYTNLLDIYEIKQKLGKGKFGLVKLGINKQTKEKVAVKIMNKNNMDSSDLELVRTEIEILKICQHPYIIKLYDVFENIDYIYIIMEHCSGGDLFSFLKKRNFMLKEEKVVVIMYKLCKAVYYMHSYGIAHRDIKPENVLLTEESEDADIRLLDFGLSKIVGPNQKCTEPYGTLTYCAPEIILDKPYLKTVDSWSLGVMTYLMLSGSLPFSGRDEHEIAKNVVYSKVDFEKKPIWKEISDEAKDFINKLLEKDLKKRIEIKAALEHPWFKKFHLQNEINDNNEKLKKRIKKANSIENDFGIYTSALKK
jgi:serine/threonine protein kinase